MAIPDPFPVRNRQALTGTSGPELPKKDTETRRTEPSEDAKSKQDHTNDPSSSHITDGDPVTLLEEDPFSSNASKVLFDGMDELRRCGTAVDLDLPQLVIVGQQSAGKSSLLKSLTDIPFPVGEGLCTRFATRIISRRSAPGTSDMVKVSIEKGDPDLFGGQQDDQAEPFNPHVPSITAAVFEDIFKQASEYMGITGQDGSKKINFSSDVLRIELNGPTRSHFGILDVPGVFHAVTDNVTNEDMKRVRLMVISHMKQPENVVICVAPATDDLANQQIFTLAKDHAESSRVVGVFTKCDLAPNPSQIVRIVRDNKEIALQNGWFVVQNLPKHAPPTSNLQEIEKETFSRGPWLEIPAKQRGTTELKKFLANTLSSRIRKAFPELQRKIKDLLAAEKDYLTTLGEERRSPERRREYLLNIVGRFQELARDALTAPDRLPSDAMKLRGLTQKAMWSFSNDMKSKGHFYDFVDVSETSLVVEPATTPLYEEIRHQNSVNQGEELAIMSNPAVLKPLFIKQSSKWESFGKRYLREVVEMCKEVALLIFDRVSSEFGIPDYTKGELQNTLAEFGAQAQRDGIRKLREFCHKNSTFLLATTDENFNRKVKEAQRARFTAALMRYRVENPPGGFVSAYVDTEPKLIPKIEQLFGDWVIINTSSLDQLFEQIHPRATRNTEDEIHDLLKAYYEVARGYFETYVIRQVVEEFLQNSTGPIFGLSDKFVLGLNEEQIDMLGGEDESVVSARYDTEKKIERLTRAMKIAGETWRKSIQLEK